MNARISKLNTRSSEQALAAFVPKKAEVDLMLARLQALSADHFGYAPDEVTWAHVGTLEHYAELLKRITDMAFMRASTPPSQPISRGRPRGTCRRGFGS